MAQKRNRPPGPIDLVFRPYQKIPNGQLTAPPSLVWSKSALQVASWKSIQLVPVYELITGEAAVELALATQTRRHYVAVVYLSGGMVARVLAWRDCTQG